MAKWTPSKHPRDSEGKFTERGGGAVPTRGSQRRVSAPQAAIDSRDPNNRYLNSETRDREEAGIAKRNREEDAWARRNDPPKGNAPGGLAGARREMAREAAERKARRRRRIAMGARVLNAALIANDVRRVLR